VAEEEHGIGLRNFALAICKLMAVLGLGISIRGQGGGIDTKGDIAGHPGEAREHKLPSKIGNEAKFPERRFWGKSGVLV
jgi:hypothetical protein